MDATLAPSPTGPRADDPAATEPVAPRSVRIARRILLAQAITGAVAAVVIAVQAASEDVSGASVAVLLVVLGALALLHAVLAGSLGPNARRARSAVVALAVFNLVSALIGTLAIDGVMAVRILDPLALLICLDRPSARTFLDATETFDHSAMGRRHAEPSVFTPPV